MKTKKIIVNIIALVLMALILGLGVADGLKSGAFKGVILYLMIAVMLISGLIGGYLLHNLLHECGHALFARLGGGRVYEVAFWGLVFSKGKIGFSFRSAYAGWTSFIPNKPEKSAKALSLSLAGGAMGSLLSLIILLLFTVIFNLFDGFYGILILSGAMSAIVYMVCLNFLSGGEGTDGQLLSDKKGARSLFWTKVTVLEAQSHMLGGKSAKEILHPVFEVSLVNRYVTFYDLLLTLSIGNLDLSERLVKAYFDQPIFDDNEHIALLLCKLLIGIVKKDASEVEKTYPMVRDVIDSDLNDPFILLVSYMHKKYSGEDQWAEAVKKTFLKSAAAAHPSGYGKTVVEIYASLSDD